MRLYLFNVFSFLLLTPSVLQSYPGFSVCFPWGGGEAWHTYATFAGPAV